MKFRDRAKAEYAEAVAGSPQLGLELAGRTPTERERDDPTRGSLTGA
jgi:hypothetical protein